MGKRKRYFGKYTFDKLELQMFAGTLNSKNRDKALFLRFAKNFIHI